MSQSNVSVKDGLLVVGSRRFNPNAICEISDEFGPVEFFTARRGYRAHGCTADEFVALWIKAKQRWDGFSGSAKAKVKR